MKKFFISIVFLTLFSCNSENHYHDGNYNAEIDFFGVQYCQMKYVIDGNDITIDNSLTGISKIKCKQYEDRIEYYEKDGSIRILYILENGDIKFNDKIVIKKVLN